MYGNSTAYMYSYRLRKSFLPVVRPAFLPDQTKTKCFSSFICVLFRLATTLKVPVLRLKGWWRGSGLLRRTSKLPVHLPWRGICTYRRNVRCFCSKILTFMPFGKSNIEHTLPHTSTEDEFLLSRSFGKCVDQILLHLWQELQDLHHEQPGGPTSQQTGEQAAQIDT